MDDAAAEAEANEVSLHMTIFCAACIQSTHSVFWQKRKLMTSCEDPAPIAMHPHHDAIVPLPLIAVLLVIGGAASSSASASSSMLLGAGQRTIVPGKSLTSR